MAATSGNQSRTSQSSVETRDYRQSHLYILRNHASNIKILQEVLFATALISLCLLLVGCTTSTPSFRDIYLLSLSYDTNSLTLQASKVNETLYGAFTSQLNDASNVVEVRAAYFGTCVLTSTSAWMCDSHLSNLIQSLRAGNHTDPLNLLWIGDKFQSETITSIFIFLTIILVLLAMVLGIIYPRYAKESYKKGSNWPTRFVRHSTKHYQMASLWSIACLVVGTLAAFTAAIWQHLASASISLVKDLAFGSVNYRTGPAALALGWIAFLLVMCGFLLSLKGAVLIWEVFRDGDAFEVDDDDDDDDDDEGSNNSRERQQPLHPFPGQAMPTMAPQWDEAMLNRMFYFAGERSGAFSSRYYENPVQVHRWRRQMNIPRGYAETIDEEGH